MSTRTRSVAQWHFTWFSMADAFRWKRCGTISDISSRSVPSLASAYWSIRWRRSSRSGRARPVVSGSFSSIRLEIRHERLATSREIEDRPTCARLCLRNVRPTFCHSVRSQLSGAKPERSLAQVFLASTAISVYQRKRPHRVRREAE